MSILALCPSRGRPAAAHAVLESLLATAANRDTRLAFIVDRDDPTANEYPAGYTVRVRPRGNMGGALAEALRNHNLLGDATIVGMIGDDCRFRTPGWDATFLAGLDGFEGIVYGDDGFQHDRLVSHWWLSRGIVDTFGMAPSWLRHFYMDNYWKELGTAAGCLLYYPNVLIEHLHPLAGKGDDDATYQRNGRHARHDRLAFEHWKKRLMHLDLNRLLRLVRPHDTPRVLADWHHPALYESLRILYEDRFGMELYSPIGMEWRQHGWELKGGTPGWTYEDYLVFPDAVDMGTHFEIPQLEYPSTPRKAVTWEQARGLRWDTVLGSVPIHQRSFQRLSRELGADRLVHQVGNAKHFIDRAVRQTVIASARVSRVSAVYHQEFSQELFHWTEPVNPYRVTSFMLRIDHASCPYEWFASDPFVEWAAYGASSPKDPGYLSPMSAVARELHQTGWVWHDKRIGDGYGHVMWNAAAVGRPLIGHASHFKGLLGEPLWEDMVTCIDLDLHDEEEALALWYEITRDHERHLRMCRAMRYRFEELVDFDGEAEMLRRVLR